MKSSSNKRILFTTDAKLAIFRTTPPAPAPGQTAEEQAEEPKVTLQGYAIVWNSLSDDRGGFQVRLLPGSAKFMDPTHALFHHNYQAILGATGNGTLRLTPDDVGVKVEIDLPDTNCAEDVAELVEDKYVRGMSFSMRLDKPLESINKNENGVEVMEVSSFFCDEVTVTAIPSFTDTAIGLKDDADPDDDEPEAPTPPATASARIEQSNRLERLRLDNLTL